MDLFLMILRFLFGMPVEAREVEPIVAHTDGKTSSGRRWLATPSSIRSTVRASTHRQRFLHSKPDWSGGLWERLCYFWRSESRLTSRRQDHCRTSSS